MRNLEGQTIGNYELQSLIGTGGTSAVYKALQTNMQREVAFKVMQIDPDNVLFVNRFRREIQTIAGLSHPHILKMFDYGQQGDLLYLVTELIMGGSVAGLISEGPLPRERIEKILGQLASALDYIHRKDIVHRDLKPHNVLLDQDGNVVLADMGLVKLLQEDEQVTRLTIEGQVMGSPPYMAPEQWTQDPISPRTDVYSLGVLLFEMLTGTLPFIASSSHQLMQKHIYEVPPAVNAVNPNLPAGLQIVIDKALAKDPGVRYESAQALFEAYRAKALEKPKIQVASRIKISPEGVVLSDAPAGEVRDPITQIAGPRTRPMAVPAAEKRVSASVPTRLNWGVLLTVGVLWCAAAGFLALNLPAFLNNTAPESSTLLALGGAVLLVLILPVIALRWGRRSDNKKP